jgi:hypothetical protein
MSDNASGPASGQCLCGSVRYRAKRLRKQVVSCHCSACRRWTGGLWRATGAVRDEIEIEDDGSLTWYQSSDKARRGFCGTCGSCLFFDHVDRHTMAVMAGTLDQPTGLELAVHIYVDDAADYEIIDDGLPQLSEGHNLTYP